MLGKGHLNPSGINSFDVNFMVATFTLTNVAPQYDRSNNVEWQYYENDIKAYANNNNNYYNAQNSCAGAHGGTLYLLTGTSDFGLILDAMNNIVQDNPVVPPPHGWSLTHNGVTVHIPRSFWTAGCCVWEEPSWIPYWPTQRAESFAVMSNNHFNQALLLQTEMTVGDLEVLLTAPNTPKVNLFPGNPNCRDPRNNIQIAGRRPPG